jgi:FSR family fosmidomycin resistance protein-like MFS transporter
MDTAEEQIKPLTISPLEIKQEKTQEDEFRTVEVVTVAAAHGAHDTYFSYLPTILPLLIKNLGLNTTQAGLLTTFTQFPNLVQPLIGHIADRKNLKMLVVLAPTFSGFLITMVGVAPSFGLAAVLLLLAGFSTAGFHSIAPAMIGNRSGKKVGRGMGYFMIGGELGFAVGPLVVVGAIGVLGLSGLPWLMTFGMLASVILYLRLKNVSTVRHAQAQASLPVRQALFEMRGLMLPIGAILFITGFLNAHVVTYLPTFMSLEGSSFAVAGASLAIIELAGSVGVFLMSMYSDRVGHRNIAWMGTLASGFFALAFLNTQGWLQLVMLVGIGMTAFVANPAYLALMQAKFTQNRALANGVYMASSFILRSIVVVVVGALSDTFGMRAVFTASSVLAMLSIPLNFLLPRR